MTQDKNPESPENRKPERPTFDLAIAEKLRDAAVKVLTDHPEVRTVACIVDYHGNLNDADIQFGVWLGEDGTIMKPDQALGSMFATLKLFHQQLQTSVQLSVNMRRTLEVLGTEINKRYAELQKLSGGDPVAAGGAEEAPPVQPEAPG